MVFILQFVNVVYGPFFKLRYLYFRGRAGFDMNTSHVFPQHVLEAITLAGVGTGDGGAGAGAGFVMGLPLCSVANTALLGMGFGPQLLEHKR